MNIVTSHLSSFFGLTETQSPRQRRAYTCSICNTEGHNAMSCSDPCINERYHTVQLLLSNYPRTMVSYGAIQNIRNEIVLCHRTHAFWRRVWLKLHELITILDTGEINRDNLEFILREPSLLANVQNYKERLYQLITKVEDDVRISQNGVVSIDEYVGLNLPVSEQMERYLVGLAGEPVPTNIMMHREYPQTPPLMSIREEKQFIFKMDSDTSNYYNHVDCPVCFEKITSENHIALNCAHTFCTQCIPEILKTKRCPSCRESIKELRFTPNINPEAFNALSSL